MLRAHFAQSLRLASSSSSTQSFLHTSAVLQVQSVRKRKSHLTEKANLQRRAEIQEQAVLNRPHVVLGTKPGDEAKWQHSDLAKVLITAEQILASPIPPAHPDMRSDDIALPTYMNYGVGAEEKELLFDILPELTTQVTMRTQASENIVAEHERAKRVERYKASMLAKIVDLRNANAKGIMFENRRRCIIEFSEPENPYDTGRPEVQAALLTMRIRNLWAHLGKCKKDIANRRSLRQLVHSRAKVLKYLKKIDRDRYERVLERLALEPASVEGELVV